MYDLPAKAPVETALLSILHHSHVRFDRTERRQIMNQLSDTTCSLRLRFIQNHPLFLSSCQRLEELEKTRIFCRHQLQHFLDVARIAYILNLESDLGISRDLIYTAALLHDIGKVRQYEEGVPHETAGELLASQILADMPDKIRFSKEEQQKILTAIRGHRKLKANAEPLETLLYKGDKMSRTCFACPASARCNWSDDKKNMTIQL